MRYLVLFFSLILFSSESFAKKICSFGADADYSIENTIWYVNYKIESLDCKKGDTIDFKMQDGWNEFPQLLMNSICDFKQSVTQDKYIRTADNGYKDEISVFSCIYTGKHADPRFDCDYEGNSDKCIPK